MIYFSCFIGSLDGLLHPGVPFCACVGLSSIYLDGCHASTTTLFSHMLSQVFSSLKSLSYHLKCTSHNEGVSAKSQR